MTFAEHLKLSLPTKIFFSFVLVAQFVDGFYSTREIDIPFAFDLLQRIAFLWLI